MSIKFLDVVDFGGIPLENVAIETVGSLPTWASTDEGRLLYNSSNGKLYYGSGSSWEELGTGTGNVLDTLTLTAGDGLTGGGDLSANRTFNVVGGTGISVAADSVSFDQTYGDGRYLTLSGGTLTGDLVLSGDPTAALEPATKQYVDAADATKAATSTTVTAGNGLTGGGSLAANRTIDVGAGTGITVGADSISVDTTWGDARYATLTGATFSGNISLGTVKLLQNGAGMADPSGVNASMWKVFLSNAGVTSDGVYAFEDGTIITLITVSGRLHVTLTNETSLYKVETSQADNTYHAVTEVSSAGVALWLNNSGGFPTQGSSYGQSPTVRGNLTVNGTTTLNTAPTVGAHATTKTYVDAADATKAATSTTVTAGAGLTGGGDLSANRTLAVGAGTGITVNADDVAFDATCGDARYATLSGATFTGDVTVPVTPSANGHAASKQYVDLTAQGLSVKAPAVAVATTDITLSGAQTIDGVSVVAGDRVLVAGQTTASQNGIYVAAAGAWSRATDADASGEVKDGTVVWVSGGTTYGDSIYVCTSTASTPWVPGTDASTWTKFTSISDLSAGAGLTKTGTTLAVGAGTGITVNADDVAIDTSVVARKYSTSVGDGSATSIAVTHSLGTKDVIVQVRANADDASVIVPWVATSTSVVTLSFAAAPANNAYRVTILG